MPDQIPVEQFIKALDDLLEETFDNVYGAYLDGGTSLFETLATISAAEKQNTSGSRSSHGFRIAWAWGPMKIRRS